MAKRRDTTNAIARKCSVEGCERLLTAGSGRGLCPMHYQRWRATGHTEKQPRVRKKCSVADCGAWVVGRGYCNTHWTRWRKHGDPLGGRKRSGDGEPLAHLLKVATERPAGCVFWSFGKDGNGYGSIIYKSQRMQVGRAMCLEIYGPAPFAKAQAAHRCGKGHLGCFGPDCVYWATPKQNADDRTLHGTTTRGEQSPVAVLTNEIASLIISDPRSSYELAKTIGVSASTVKAVRNGSTWGHLTNGMKQPTRTRKTLRGESNGNSVLTNEQVLEVYCGSTPGAELARRFGVSRTLIYRIRQGKVWRHVTLST